MFTFNPIYNVPWLICICLHTYARRYEWGAGEIKKTYCPRTLYLGASSMKSLFTLISAAPIIIYPTIWACHSFVTIIAHSTLALSHKNQIIKTSVHKKKGTQAVPNSLQPLLQNICSSSLIKRIRTTFVIYQTFPIQEMASTWLHRARVTCLSLVLTLFFFRRSPLGIFVSYMTKFSRGERRFFYFFVIIQIVFESNYWNLLFAELLHQNIFI